jgi:GT2 family glycosyltransferase
MITASIVTYKHRFDKLEALVCSIANNDHISKLFIIDNSPFNNLQKEIGKNIKIEIVYMGSNKGFGAAHNIAIQKVMGLGSKYHFIVNPDISLSDDVVMHMVNYMAANPKIGMMMPKVLYPDGRVQYLPKLLPSPLSIIKRKLKRPSSSYNKFISAYELRDYTEQITNVPILSGCFTLLNLNAVKEVGAYDNRFFMYFEDFDLSRRMFDKYETIYYPLVSVYHGYESGAQKNLKLFVIFVLSALKYFNKWGWFFDFERNRINKEELEKRRC